MHELPATPERIAVDTLYAQLSTLGLIEANVSSRASARAKLISL